MRKVTLLTLAVVIALAVTVGTAAAQPQNFRARLSGGEEVPPVATNARGQTQFQLDSSGTMSDFRLIVANIQNVFAAHIHCAPQGSNGPVGVTLFSTPPPNPGPVNGVLAQGTITAPDVGNGCGWASLAAVVTAMQSGNTYVNVHTPGFPGGEIRGQIR